MDMTGSGDSVLAGEYSNSVDVYLGDVPVGAGEGAGGATNNFLEMFNGYHSTGDLFELVRRGGGNTVMSPPQLPEVLPEPPSEEEMAAWLYPIVRGEEFASDHSAGNGEVSAGLIAARHQQVLVKEPSKQLRRKVRVRTKQNCAEGTSDSGGRRTTARKSNYSETHSLTEKRRRCKVNERFRTLQQLVPGCDKSNQASTLDRTIQYMKSLQQQVESMSSVTGCSMMPVVAAYPPPPCNMQLQGCVVTAQPSILLPAGGEVDPTIIVPFARSPVLLSLVHHAALMMPTAPLIHRTPTTTPNIIPEAAKSMNQGHKD